LVISRHRLFIELPKIAIELEQEVVNPKCESGHGCEPRSKMVIAYFRHQLEIRLFTATFGSTYKSSSFL